MLLRLLSLIRLSLALPQVAISPEVVLLSWLHTGIQGSELVLTDTDQSRRDPREYTKLQYLEGLFAGCMCSKIGMRAHPSNVVPCPRLTCGL